MHTIKTEIWGDSTNAGKDKIPQLQYGKCRIMETHFMNDWHMWIAYRDSSIQEIQIFPKGFRVYHITAVCRCLGAWRVGVFPRLCGLTREHAQIQSHIHAPSASPSNHPPTHTSKCKHGKTEHQTIHPHWTTHWRTLKGLYRFVLIYCDWFLRYMQLQWSGLVVEAGRDNLCSSVSG